MLADDGKVHQVCSFICAKIEARDKLLLSKLDSLYKHQGRQKTKLTILGACVKGEYYVSHECIHVKNEMLLLTLNCDIVVEQLTHGVPLERRRKIKINRPMYGGS